jgi:phosphopantothenoylcysteine synthetase/decarboxylase
MRFLVTAGNTREAIDRVRDWGNIFTGNTGLAIAKALSKIGHVDLLTSNQQHLGELQGEQAAEHSITPTPFRSHADLRAALTALVRSQQYDAICMTAAVADYRPAGVFAIERREIDPNDSKVERWVVRNVQTGKVKSNHPSIAIRGEQTEKIVDLFRKEWRYQGLLFKFKLEVGITEEELLKIGEASRLASGADYLVANTLDMVEGDRAGAFLLGDSGRQWVPRGKLPGRIVEIVRQRYNL